MNFFGNLLHIRCLLLFFAVGLLTTTLSAQAVSQNINEPQEIGKTPDKDETTDKDEIAKDTKETELKKQVGRTHLNYLSAKYTQSQIIKGLLVKS